MFESEVREKGRRGAYGFQACWKSIPDLCNQQAGSLVFAPKDQTGNTKERMGFRISPTAGTERHRTDDNKRLCLSLVRAQSTSGYHVRVGCL